MHYSRNHSTVKDIFPGKREKTILHDMLAKYTFFCYTKAV